MRSTALWAVLILLAGSAPVFATTYGSHYGLVDQWGTDGSGADPMSVILTNLGAKWIRSGWDWDLIEGLGDNQYDAGYLALMDNWATTMAALGVNIYYGFSYTPAWARPGGTQHNTPPTDPSRYTDFITFMVNRYKTRIKYWGFWNEPNIDGFWNGTDDNYIHNFLIPGIAAVKAADPTAKTVVGELASCCNEVSLLQTFLTEINAHGEKGLVDVISVHGYGYGDTASGRIAHMDALRNTIVSAGYGDKEFWCTETSWDGKGTSSGETNQANQIVAFMQGMDSRPWWKKTFYFTLSEGPGATQGLVRSDLSLKPAYTQYQALIAEHADDAEIVSDTIPSSMYAGRAYYVSVTVKNTGTVSWGYQYRLGAVDDSDPFADGRQYLGTSETVAPDATRTFWFWMTAPGTTGNYTTDWRMVHESVRWFGHPLVKQINVNTNPDTTAPGPVANLAATPGDNRITLSWTNPVDADFTKAMIRFKTTGYPTSPTDGTLVADEPGLPGQTDSYVHTGRINGTTYYYSVFAHDVAPNFSGSATVSGVPVDLVAPGPVTNMGFASGDSQLTLSWRNPGDSDFVATMIRYRADSYPTSTTDGTLLIEKAGSPGGNDSCVHTGLTNWQPVYYTAFARDEVPFYSTGANLIGKARGQVRYQEEFSYPNGNLNGAGAWHGSATTQILVEDTCVKVVVGSTLYDAIQDFIPDCDGDGTAAGVEFRIKQGLGTNMVWSLRVDDTAARNFAHWYGSGTTVRGRIGGGSQYTSFLNLTADWDSLYVKINFATNRTQFFLNGVSIADFDHSETGAGDSIGSIRIERMNQSAAAGQYVYLDHAVVATPDVLPPSSSASPPSAAVTRTGPVSFTVSFGEPVFGFDSSGDVQVNATGSAHANTVAVTGSGSGPYTVTLSDIAGDGTLGIGVKSGCCVDKAGLGNTASSPSATVRVVPQDGSIAACKSLPNDQSVELGNKALYFKQSGYGYIEEPDRTSGMRLQGGISPTEGDLVCLTGVMKTTSGGERYILVGMISRCGGLPIDPLAMNNTAVRDALVEGLYVKCWGRVKAGSIIGNSYVLTDGSDTAGIRVFTPGAPGVSDNEYVTIDGAAGYDAARVIYRR